MNADIMCGDKRLVTGCANADDKSNQGSVTVVTECDAGEPVWVRSTSGTFSAYGESMFKYNVFSGFLLQPY